MTLFHALGPFASSGGVVAAPGMVLMKPTSITHSGTSASLGANGQVTFSAVTSLSLNGCFTGDFDNYVLSIRASAATGNQIVRGRLRSAGSDASGSDYVRQELFVDNTTVEGSRATIDFFFAGITRSTLRSGAWTQIYGPALAQPTAMRLVSSDAYLNATISDYAGTHSLSTAYDGVTLYPSGSEMTGAVQVYGLRS